MLHYLWSAEKKFGEKKNFSQLIMSTLSFSQYSFSIDFARWKSMALLHVVYIVIR